MIIDLTRLRSGIDKEINIDLVQSFEDYINKKEVLKLDDVKIQGKIYKDSLNNICINVNVSGVMVLPCAITLKPVDYEFNLDIEGNLEEICKENDESFKNLENSIDILPIIWENILMEIPMRVISEEAHDVKLEGDGWRLITDDESLSVNPEFEKLNKLFDEK